MQHQTLDIWLKRTFTNQREGAEHCRTCLRDEAVQQTLLTVISYNYVPQWTTQVSTSAQTIHIPAADTLLSRQGTCQNPAEMFYTHGSGCQLLGWRTGCAEGTPSQTALEQNQAVSTQQRPHTPWHPAGSSGLRGWSCATSSTCPVYLRQAISSCCSTSDPSSE